MTARRAAAAGAFRAGHARGERWQEVVDRALAGMGEPPPGASLGFVYLSDRLGGPADKVLARLRAATGVETWVGSVGLGVLASGVEYFDEPALSVMLAALPAGEFQVFSGKRRPPLLGTRTASGAEAAHFAIVHGDPGTGDMPELLEDMSSKLASGYLVGGLSSSRSAAFQIADEVLQGGLSGVVLSSRIELATRLTQGCSPLRRGSGATPVRHEVTEGERNVILALDGKPALEVLRAEAGAVFGDDFRGAAQAIHVGLPVPGSDTGDYLVRNLIGIDPKHQAIAIGAYVEPGMQVMFCRRDRASAREDLERALDGIAAQLDGPPRGALYYACVGRGEHMFGRRSVELGIIRDRLGDVPLTGFFCNGEISHDRLYGYTGVLTLFR